jgi:hypothetical protein
VTLGMSLPCLATGPGAELEINWFNPQPDPPGRESFHMTLIEQAWCDTNSPSPNDGGVHEGQGTGFCTTRTGSRVPADITWSFTDSGVDNPNIDNPNIDNPNIDNPNSRRSDSAEFQIRSALPGCSLIVNGPLDGGNLRMVNNPNI